VYLLKQQLYL